jgi:hypothetical protein
MNPTYSCPECDSDIECAENAKTVTCRDCKTQYRIDYDAEFDHGQWRNLTSLTKMTGMKAYEFYNRFFELPPERQHYVLGYFSGSVDCVATGFTTPHKDQAHAQWAINELENALNHVPRDKDKNEH